MPIYEYVCDGCEREFEVEQRITEDPLRSCPRCRSRKVRRLISQTSFVLKGGGWYSDLYSSSRSKSESPSTEGAADTKSDASEAKTPKHGEAAASKGPKDPGSGGRKAEAKAKAA
jgi:putative FmdB family regulatory protein